MQQRLLSLFLAGMLTTILTTSALAHARYRESSPGDGETLATAPAEVSIWYSEGLQAPESWIHVTDAAGARVDLDDSTVIGDDYNGLRVHLQPNLPAGAYTVNWQNLSEDGDGLTGSFQFGIGTAVAPSMTRAMGPTPELAIERAEVNGHEVRLHVDVEGVTLGMGAPAAMDMDHSQGHDMNMDMDHGQSHDMDMAGHEAGTAMDSDDLPMAHLHVYVDGAMVLMVEQPDIVLPNLSSGTHQIRIDLSDNQHRDWDPPISAATTISVP